MKKPIVTRLSAKCFSLFAFLLGSLYTFAQDGDGKLLDIDIDVDRNEWYENPWVWVGVGVFVLLLVLIARNRK